VIELKAATAAAVGVAG